MVLANARMLGANQRAAAAPRLPAERDQLGVLQPAHLGRPGLRRRGGGRVPGLGARRRLPDPAGRGHVRHQHGVRRHPGADRVRAGARRGGRPDREAADEVAAGRRRDRKDSERQVRRMAKDFDAMEDSNRSANPSIHEVSDPSRRIVLRGGLGAAFAPSLVRAASPPAWPAAPCPGRSGRRRRAGIGFTSVPASSADRLTVPAGYEATPFMPWGEPVGIAGAMPAFRDDAGNSAAEQALQMGMHHDGLHYFPLDGSRARPAGDEPRVHRRRPAASRRPGRPGAPRRCGRAQAAHGVSVIEVAPRGRRWQPVRPSRYARRITAATPFAVGGPAAGHALMRTAADPTGRLVLGTFNNCASGMTPWGTYLTGEENFAYYFNAGEQPSADERALGPAQGRQRLPLARVRRALRRRHASERAEPLRLGRRDRSARSAEPAGQAHRARARRARRRLGRGDARPARRRLHGRRRALRVHLQVRQPRPDRPRGARDEQRDPARPRHALRRALRRRRPRPLAAAGRTARGRYAQRLRRPGRGGHQGAPGERRARRHEDGSSRVDRDRPERRAGSTARSPTTRVAASRTFPASTPPIRAPTT